VSKKKLLLVQFTRQTSILRRSARKVKDKAWKQEGGGVEVGVGKQEKHTKWQHGWSKHWPWTLHLHTHITYHTDHKCHLQTLVGGEQNTKSNLTIVIYVFYTTNHIILYHKMWLRVMLLYRYPQSTHAQTKITPAHFILGQNEISACCATHTDDIIWHDLIQLGVSVT